MSHLGSSEVSGQYENGLRVGQWSLKEESSEYSLQFEKGSVQDFKLVSGSNILKTRAVMNLDSDSFGGFPGLGAKWLKASMQAKAGKLDSNGVPLGGNQVFKSTLAALDGCTFIGALDDKGLDQLLTKSNTTPQILDGGWQSHHINFVVYKGSLVICNKGNGAFPAEVRDQRVFGFDHIKPTSTSAMKSLLIDLRAMNEAPNSSSGKQHLDKIRANKDYKFVLNGSLEQKEVKKQRAENCFYQSVQAAAQVTVALLSRELGVEGGAEHQDIYNLVLSGRAMREDALAEYLPAKVSQDKSYDPMTDDKLIGDCGSDLSVTQKKRALEISNCLLDLHIQGKLNMEFSGSQNGVGTLSLGGQLIYSGAFKNGVPQGEGSLHSSYGPEKRPTVIFTGQFAEGRRNGPGKEYIGPSLVFEGGFKDGLRHGEGQMYDLEELYDSLDENFLSPRDGKTNFRFGSAVH